MRFNDKIVLITGSSKGIGKQLALDFALEGATVIINAFHDTNTLDETFNILKTYTDKCYSICCDVSNPTDVSDMFTQIYKKYGRIDILINNAGISDYNLITDIEIERINKIISTNLTSAIYCSKEALKSMLKNKSGVIINVSSIWGKYGASYEVTYATSKGGLDTFTKSLAKEVGPSNIRANAVSCGFIDTEMNNSISESDKNYFINEHTMLGRCGNVNDVSNLVLFLASESASYITGQIIGIDGGFI